MPKALLGKAPHTPRAWLESVQSIAAKAFPAGAEIPEPDASAALYRCAPVTLSATVILGLAMTMAVDLFSASRTSSAWLIAFLLVTGVRLLHAMFWRQAASAPDPAVLVSSTRSAWRSAACCGRRCPGSHSPACRSAGASP